MRDGNALLTFGGGWFCYLMGENSSGAIISVHMES
jgi:hypothetical protein